MEKKLEQTHLEIRQKYPDSEVEIWAMDEQTLEDSLTLRYRLGLKPILRGRTGEAVMKCKLNRLV